jgi:site-specific recombinase XerD
MQATNGAKPIIITFKLPAPPPEDVLYTLLPQEKLREIAKYIPHGKTPVWAHWEKFVNHYKRKGKSRTTIKNVRDALKWLIKHIEIYTIEDCFDTFEIDERFHAYQEIRGIQGNTLNSYRKNLNTYFIYLERYNFIPSNPIKRIQKCAEKYREKPVMSDDQINQIIAHLSTRRQTRLQRARNIFFIDLLRFTGARPCELAALKTSDIIPFQGTHKLVIHGAKQKGKNRYYRLKGYVRDSYERYMSIRNQMRPNENHLFVSSSKRTGWGQKGMNYLFKKLRKELSFHISAYAFRRYVATKLYKEGMLLPQISDYLGHTRISTTRRYLEDICAWTDEAGDIMGKKITDIGQGNESVQKK